MVRLALEGFNGSVEDMLKGAHVELTKQLGIQARNDQILNYTNGSGNMNKELGVWDLVRKLNQQN